MTFEARENKGTHPLKFAYGKIFLRDMDLPLTDPVSRANIYKVFHVEPTLIRVRSITYANGVEKEGPNVWIPMASMDMFVEIEE